MIPGLPSVPRNPAPPPPHVTLTFPSLSLKETLERENQSQREHPSLWLAFSPPRKIVGLPSQVGKVGHCARGS